MARASWSLSRTPVRDSVHEVAGELEYIHINSSSIEALAEDWADHDFRLPSWNAPVFPDTSTPGTRVGDVLDFFFVGNAINFAFRDFETGKKFTVEYGGIEYQGAFAMWACLKDACDRGVPILFGEYLSTIERSEFETLFEPTSGPPIPMADERFEILRDVGDRLVTYYDGRFSDLVRDATPRLYDGGDGIIDRLVAEFPSFLDEHHLETASGPHTVRFDKRAQLAPAMAYGRFRDTSQFELADPGSFTVFADYNLPNVLRHLGILEYEARLASTIDSEEVLASGSQEEVELRVATVAAADRLIQLINDSRQEPIYGPHMDYKLFAERDLMRKPVHKVKTTDY